MFGFAASPGHHAMFACSSSRQSAASSVSSCTALRLYSRIHLIRWAPTCSRSRRNRHAGPFIPGGAGDACVMARYISPPSVFLLRYTSEIGRYLRTIIYVVFFLLNISVPPRSYDELKEVDR